MPKRCKRLKARPKIINDDEWIRKNFQKLVDTFGGQHIIVANGKVFVGDNGLEKAKKKYPNVIPTSMPVPRPEEFMHILIICPNP